MTPHSGTHPKWVHDPHCRNLGAGLQFNSLTFCRYVYDTVENLLEHRRS